MRRKILDAAGIFFKQYVGKGIIGGPFYIQNIISWNFAKITPIPESMYSFQRKNYFWKSNKKYFGRKV